MEKVPLYFELMSINLNVVLEHSILEFFDVTRFPKEWKIWSVNNLEVGVKERVLAFHLLVHNIDNKL